MYLKLKQPQNVQNKQEFGYFVAGAGGHQGDFGQTEAREGEKKVGNVEWLGLPEVGRRPYTARMHLKCSFLIYFPPSYYFNAFEMIEFPKTSNL